MLGAHRDAWGSQKDATKMPHAHQKKHCMPMMLLGFQINFTCPLKETLCANKDARWPPKEMPAAHQYAT